MAVSDVVPQVILGENSIGQVLTLDTDPLRPGESGMEIKIRNVHGHPAASGLGNGEVNENLDDLQVSTPCRNIAWVMNAVPASGSADTVGFFVSKFVTLFFRLWVEIRGVAAAISGLFVGMTRVQRLGVQEPADFVVARSLPVRAIRTGEAELEGQRTTVGSHIKRGSSVGPPGDGDVFQAAKTR